MSASKNSNDKDIGLGPVFFVAAILGILAAAIAVGCGSLSKSRAPTSVTVKMLVDQ